MQGVIVVDDLTVKYKDFTAVDKISFIVERSEVFGFLGPNGSGKTTLIKTLCGFVKPASGRAMILGMDVSKNLPEIKGKIGYMSQKFGLYEDMTVDENMGFYGSVYGLEGTYLKRRKEEVISLTGLGPYLKRYANTLSGGWKQRLALACAIIHEPEIVFLDEPTAGIDPVARREIWNLLFRLSGQGVTFFVTTHYMDEAERCGRVGYIYLSKLIACGTPDELKILPEVTPENTIRLEVTCRAPTAALAFINRLSYIMESTIFGQSIHVLIDAAKPVEKFISDLTEVGFGKVEVRVISPSIEDVFVTLTNRITQGSSVFNGKLR
jgi:ABC-2 type transport system ATP-binding protein